MNNLLESNQLNQIINLSKQNSNIVALILFGSYANQTYNDKSDIDLCIIRTKNSENGDFLDILDFKDNIFDIHFLDKLPDYIQFRIFSEGKILYINDEPIFYKLRKKFLHTYRSEFLFKEKRLKKMLESI